MNSKILAKLNFYKSQCSDEEVRKRIEWAFNMLGKGVLVMPLTDKSDLEFLADYVGKVGKVFDFTDRGEIITLFSNGYALALCEWDVVPANGIEVMKFNAVLTR